MNSNLNGNLVANLIFCDSNWQIIKFKKLATPTPYEEINLPKEYDMPFKFALINFQNGTSEIYKYSANA